MQCTGSRFDLARSVGRILDREVLNLGFSGNCRMQADVAALLVELKPAAFVVDCLPNMDAATVTQRAVYASHQIPQTINCLTLSIHFSLFPTNTVDNFLLPHCRCAAVLRNRPLFKQLREGLGPHVPIVILEGHTYSNAWLLPSVQSEQAAKRVAQKAAFDAVKKTDQNIHYIEGGGKLSSLTEQGYDEHDATSGIGVHPSNLAHLHIGQYVASHLKSLLQ